MKKILLSLILIINSMAIFAYPYYPITQPMFSPANTNNPIARMNDITLQTQLSILEQTRRAGNSHISFGTPETYSNNSSSQENNTTSPEPAPKTSDSDNSDTFYLFILGIIALVLLGIF